MIDLTKKYVCDSCDVISGKKHHVDTYEIKLKKTGKRFVLCENCLKELYKIIQDTMQK